MTKVKLGNSPWDNSDVQQESIEALKSLVEEGNIFNRRADVLKNIASGTFNLYDLVYDHREGICKKTIKNPQDLMLTKADLPHNKLIEID
jgi:hypothetical protein